MYLFFFLMLTDSLLTFNPISTFFVHHLYMIVIKRCFLIQ